MSWPDEAWPTWWQRRGLIKDPVEMTPQEREAAQMVLLDQWLRDNEIRRYARSLGHIRQATVVERLMKVPA